MDLIVLFKLFCLKNVRHQTAVSSQLTACTTLNYHFDTYDTIFHSLAFPPLLLADCHQALWVGMRSKTQKMAMKIARARKAQFRRRASAVPNLIVIWFDCSTAGKQL